MPWLLLVLLCHGGLSGTGRAEQQGTAPPSAELESLVIRAFTQSHEGWSVDEVLLQDELRTEFCRKCEELAETKHVETVYCQALLHVRKRGGKLPKSTRRAKRIQLSSEQLALAEIAARQLQEAFEDQTDALLVRPEAREEFDRVVHSFLPEVDAYILRKAALTLRKSRRLEPELVARVADWKKEIVRFDAEALSQDLQQVPERPGVYIFQDETGYLYIGQAKDLRERLTSHLRDSDRKSLASYLVEASTESHAVELEIHVFLEGSPGEDTRMRRAYESELIRTRKPRFNLAP